MDNGDSEYCTVHLTVCTVLYRTGSRVRSMSASSGTAGVDSAGGETVSSASVTSTAPPAPAAAVGVGACARSI